MENFLDAALGASAVTSLVRFATFLILGVGTGWVLAGRARWRRWPGALAVMGVCGAWMGAEAACLFGQAEMGSQTALLAAILGAVGLACAWRRHHPEALDAALPGGGSTPR